MNTIKRLETLMNDRHWSRYRLAKKADLSQSSISNIFHRGSIPTIPTLEILCKAFGVSLSEFFEEDADNETDEKQELLRYWRTLDAEQQHIIIQLLKCMNRKV